MLRGSTPTYIKVNEKHWETNNDITMNLIGLFRYVVSICSFNMSPMSLRNTLDNCLCSVFGANVYRCALTFGGARPHLWVRARHSRTMIVLACGARSQTWGRPPQKWRRTCTIRPRTPNRGSSRVYSLKTYLKCYKMLLFVNTIQVKRFTCVLCLFGCCIWCCVFVARRTTHK